MSLVFKWLKHIYHLNSTVIKNVLNVYSLTINFIHIIISTCNNQNLKQIYKWPCLRQYTYRLKMVRTMVSDLPKVTKVESSSCIK